MNKRQREKRRTARDAQPHSEPIKSAMAQDAYTNQAARLGWGQENLIESAEYPMTRLTLNYMLLLSLYRTNGILRRIVNKPAEDSCAHWGKVDSQITPGQMDALERLIKQTDLKKNIETGIKWARLFGGAAGLILIDGQGDMLDQPLDLQSIEPGSFKGIYIVDRWSGIYPDVGTIDDINSPDFGLPEYYEVRINEDSTAVMRVHYSRIVRFVGEELPYWEKLMEMGWGASVIETIFDELKMYDNTKFNIANLIFQANVWVQKSDGLEEMLSAAPRAAQERLWQTIHAQQTLMSSFNTRVVGKEDELQNHQYTFAGLSDVFDVFMYALSAVTSIPVTVLFGRSPAGENATGESDMENYYALCEGIQEGKIRPVMEQLLPIMCMSEFGAVPDDLNWRFNPIHNATDKENAELATQLTTAANEAYNLGVITQQQALAQYRSIADLTGNVMWGNITDEDIEQADSVPEIGDVPEIGGEPGNDNQELEHGGQNLLSRERLNTFSSDSAVQKPSIQEIKKAAQEFRPKYDVVAVRTQEAPFKLGPLLHKSVKWTNGEPTSEKLDGISATSVGSSAIRKHTDEFDPREGQYQGDYCAIIGGNKFKYGHDKGEVVIKDPVVLKILRPESGGKSI